MSADTQSLVSSFWHVGVTVEDMERSLEFYRDALGLEMDSDREVDHPFIFAATGIPCDSIRIVFLKVPHSSIIVELLEYRGVERHPASSRPCDPANGHFAFITEDIELLVAKLHDLGYTSRSKSPVEVATGPRKGAKCIYIHDPDGHIVEFVQYPPGYLG